LNTRKITIIIIIIILVITRMHGIYNYIPETNHVSRAHSAVAVGTRVGTLIVATIYLQLIQNRYMFRTFTVL